MTPDQIAVALAIDTWPGPARLRGVGAAELACRVFAGVVRDQGTPYITHPVAVAQIVLDAGETDAETLIVALLHDALEVDPAADAALQAALGEQTVQAVRDLTPDHRLAGRRRGPGDDDAYHRKIAVLPDGLVVVKLADRLHNLRDLPASTNPDRAHRFLAQLTEFYLPLAVDRARRCATIATVAVSLAAEHRAHPSG